MRIPFMQTPHLTRAGLATLLLVALGCASLPEQPPIEAQPLQFGQDEWRVTDHVILITDASGTMYVNETFPEAKALTRSFVAAMPAADAPSERTGGYAAGAVGFGGDERNVAPLAPFDRGALSSQAKTLEIMGDVSGTGGTTPLDAVLREAGTSLAGRSGRAALVIFSDGMPDDQAAALFAAKRPVTKHSSEVCIHAVQTGTDPEGEAFLKRLTGLSSCGRLRNGDQVTTGFEVQQLARAVFAGPAPLPPVAAAGPCAGVVRLSGIEFPFDRAEITEASRPVLDVAVSRLAECPEIRVTITGHTDSIGDEKYNAGLSYRRAEATRQYLVDQGISAGRLEAEGLGESEPVAPNDTSEGRAQNRRVELGPTR
jgi:OOP family OmpA-OmpF porin